MDWRKSLYDAYVSSGQARLTEEDVLGAVKQKRHVIDAIVRRFFPTEKSTPILDLGCGFGAALYVAKERGYVNVAGVDTSPEMVAAAARLGVHEVVLGQIRSHLASLDAATVGVVLAFDVLEHLERGELFETLSEVSRVLAPGGRLIAQVPNAQAVFSGNIRYGDLTHELAFTPSSLNQLLRMHGFGPVSCHEIRPIPHGFTSAMRAIVWRVGSIFPRLLFAAETGDTNALLTMNILCVADRKK